MIYICLFKIYIQINCVLFYILCTFEIYIYTHLKYTSRYRAECAIFIGLICTPTDRIFSFAEVCYYSRHSLDNRMCLI